MAYTQPFLHLNALTTPLRVCPQWGLLSTKPKQIVCTAQKENDQDGDATTLSHVSRRLLELNFYYCVIYKIKEREEEVCCYNRNSCTKNRCAVIIETAVQRKQNIVYQKINSNTDWPSAPCSSASPPPPRLRSHLLLLLMHNSLSTNLVFYPGSLL